MEYPMTVEWLSEHDAESLIPDFFTQQIADLEKIHSDFKAAIQEAPADSRRLAALQAQTLMAANLTTTNIMLVSVMNRLRKLTKKIVNLLNHWLSRFWSALWTLLNSLMVTAGTLSEWSMDLTLGAAASLKIGLKFVPPAATTTAAPAVP